MKKYTLSDPDKSTVSAEKALTYLEEMAGIRVWVFDSGTGVFNYFDDSQDKQSTYSVTYTVNEKDTHRITNYIKKHFSEHSSEVGGAEYLWGDGDEIKPVLTLGKVMTHSTEGAPIVIGMTMPKAALSFPERETYSLSARLPNTNLLASRFTLNPAIQGKDIDVFSISFDLHDVYAHHGTQGAHNIYRRVTDLLSSKLTEHEHLAMGDDMNLMLFRESDLAENTQATDIITTINSQLFEEEDETYKLRSVIGLARGQAEDARELAIQATLASRYAREKGLSEYVVDYEFLKKERRHKRLLADIGEEIESGENFRIVLQPLYKKINSTHQIDSFEALARWEHPEYGFISPMEFIPMIEGSRHDYAFGITIIRKILTHIKNHPEFDFTQTPIAANISGFQIQNPALILDLQTLLEEFNLPPQVLKIEITERGFIDNEIIVRNNLFGLSEIGVAISMDDFGSDGANLFNLTKYPFSTIKIDKSLIDLLSDSTHEKFAKSTLKHVVALCNECDCQTVAEGIETEEALNVCQSLGFDFIQGYYFSKPLETEASVKLL